MGDYGEGPLGTKLGQGATSVKYPRPTRVKNKTSAPTQVRPRPPVRPRIPRAETANLALAGSRPVPLRPPATDADPLSPTRAHPVRPSHPCRSPRSRSCARPRSTRRRTSSAPTQKIADVEELAEYRLQKRKEFEDLIRRVYWNESVWVKYAKWEESQKDFARARSVWERALDHHYRSQALWLKYAEMEMSNKFVNHARNVWDRAVTLLPRVDQFWYKYVHMEEMMGQDRQRARHLRAVDASGSRITTAGTRTSAWRRGTRSGAACAPSTSGTCECHPSVKAWVRWAKFEMSLSEVARAREVYEHAAESMAYEVDADQLYAKFAEFEIMARSASARAASTSTRSITFPRIRRGGYTSRSCSSRSSTAIARRSRTWFSASDGCSTRRRCAPIPPTTTCGLTTPEMEESNGDVEKTREVYERAIACVPPASEKRYWRRYIYLWINYALFEELEAQDAERTREVYRECLKLVPHKTFSFSKIWIMAATFEIRQKRLDAARKILGMAIGLAPKDKIFKAYIDVEMQLGNVDEVSRALPEGAREPAAQLPELGQVRGPRARSRRDGARARGVRIGHRAVRAGHARAAVEELHRL